MPDNTSRVNNSRWLQRSMKVVVCPGTLASVSRFIVDFAAWVAPDCDECEGGCTNCPPEKGREYQAIVRLSVGPPLREVGKPDKRGVRVDAWVGMTSEPAAEKYEGSVLDEANEMIMTQGTVAMLKLPRLEEEEVCAFPGLGLMLEWPQCDDADEHDLIVMPTSAMPLHTLLLSPINDSHAVTCRHAPEHHRASVMATVPEFVPKAPPAPVAAKPPRKKRKKCDDDKDDVKDGDKEGEGGEAGDAGEAGGGSGRGSPCASPVHERA